MSESRVVAIMLTHDRPELARKAVECFRAQTYQKKQLLIYNSNTPVEYGHVPNSWELGDGVSEIPAGHRGLTIGELRNAANDRAEADIVCHWDDDDWSHPNRIAEQVALLQSSGKQCVGYRDMLFWGENATATQRHPDNCDCGTCRPGKREVIYGPVSEAWLYHNKREQYCIGTSLCYWRSVWEQRPFQDLPKVKGGTGEDNAWLEGVDSLGETSLFRASGPSGSEIEDLEPRMIARIHGANTQYYGDDLLHGGDDLPEGARSWLRVPDWDSYCREVLK